MDPTATLAKGQRAKPPKTMAKTMLRRQRQCFALGLPTIDIGKKESLYGPIQRQPIDTCPTEPLCTIMFEDTHGLTWLNALKGTLHPQLNGYGA